MSRAWRWAIGVGLLLLGVVLILAYKVSRSAVLATAAADTIDAVHGPIIRAANEEVAKLEANLKANAVEIARLEHNVTVRKMDMLGVYQMVNLSQTDIIARFRGLDVQVPQ